jgi:hypothetical protein
MSPSDGLGSPESAQSSVRSQDTINYAPSMIYAARDLRPPLGLRSVQATPVPNPRIRGTSGAYIEGGLTSCQRTSMLTFRKSFVLRRKPTVAAPASNEEGLVDTRDKKSANADPQAPSNHGADYSKSPFQFSSRFHAAISPYSGSADRRNTRSIGYSSLETPPSPDPNRAERIQSVEAFKDGSSRITDLDRYFLNSPDLGTQVEALRAIELVSKK